MIINTINLDNISKLNTKYFNEILNLNEDNDDEETKNSDNDHKCLISNLPLDDNHITLNCNHKFNYVSIYNEVVYQKTKRLLDNASLRLHEIKCPYCRSITDKLLPYYKFYSVKQIKGVNLPMHLCMKMNECSYITKTVKCTGSACLTKDGYLCNKHLKQTKSEETLLDNCNKDLCDKYHMMTLLKLKLLLKENNCKQTGNKLDLINRILIAQMKNSSWKE